MTSAEADLANAHAIEDVGLAVWGGKKIIRVELLMDYSEAFSANPPDVHPVAAVRWTTLSDEFPDERAVRDFKIILAAFLYGKALACDQLRAELFQNVADALEKCLASGDALAEQPLSAAELTFAPIVVRGEAFANLVWPWELADWSDVEERLSTAAVRKGAPGTSTLLSATLLVGPMDANVPCGTWLRLRGVGPLMKIMIPAAPLIAVSCAWKDIPEGRGMMWSLLKNINDYHETPGQITNSEAFAMQAALEVYFSQGTLTIEEFRRQSNPARHSTLGDPSPVLGPTGVEN